MLPTSILIGAKRRGGCGHSPPTSKSWRRWEGRRRVLRPFSSSVAVAIAGRKERLECRIRFDESFDVVVREQESPGRQRSPGRLQIPISRLGQPIQDGSIV